MKPFASELKLDNWVYLFRDHVVQHFVYGWEGNPKSLHSSSSGWSVPGIASNTQEVNSLLAAALCIHADASSHFIFILAGDKEANFFEGLFIIVHPPWFNSVAFRNRSVAASHDNSCICESLNGAGSSLKALRVKETNPLLSSYVRQLGNCLKNSLEGWLAQTTIFPIANASAVVVQTTSVVLGLRNTL